MIMPRLESLITTDGTICDLKRENYIEAEDKTIRELQSIGKPFVVLVNSKDIWGRGKAGGGKYKAKAWGYGDGA